MNDPFLDLFKLAMEKKYEFQYETIEEKVNFFAVDEENKIVNITIGDPENKDILPIIEEIKQKLQ